jgi:hypothetical protein
MVPVVTCPFSCLTLLRWSAHLGPASLNLSLIGLRFKFQCMVYKKVLFEQKTIKLWNKQHFVENKKQIMQHVLKCSNLACCLKIHNEFSEVFKGQSSKTSSDAREDAANFYTLYECLVTTWVKLKRTEQNQECVADGCLVYEHLPTMCEHAGVVFCITYDWMWKNIVQLDRPQMTIWCMYFACWITKATDIHSEYILLTAFAQ